MAYPFVKLLRKREFIEQCCTRFGCELVENPKTQTQGLRRRTGHGLYFTPLPTCDMEQQLARDVTLSMYVRLGIDPAEAGYPADPLNH